MFFLMARKSNFIPTAVKSFDPSKQLIRKDIQVSEDMLVVNIKWSKTRQFDHSHQVPILATPGSCLCPVTAYKNMISKVAASQSDPAFCVFSGSKKATLVPLIYSQFQTKFRDLIARTGRDKSSFSTHSLHRGGCSWAFKSKV